MIDQIQLIRFKRFGELSITSQQLTVLTGTNGSGKTSVIHALLLARQTGDRTSAVVQLNGPDGLQLGAYADVLNHEAEPEGGFEVATKGTDGEHRWQFHASDEHSLTLQVTCAASPLPALAAQDRRFTYLSANRLGPQDSLPAASAPTAALGVGHRGEHVAQVLAVLDRYQVLAGRRHPDVEQLLLRHHTEGWLKEVARPLLVLAEWFPRSTITRILYKHPTARAAEWVRPPNMGFGVSTVLPIIVAGLTAQQGGLFIVENPEIHLHPAGQSAIGRFVAQVAADGVQVVLETHSDHVINGIRRAVAEGVLPANNTIIQYFDQHVTEITIDERGKLSQWPAGFFDQIDQDLRALAQHRRRG